MDLRSRLGGKKSSFGTGPAVQAADSREYLGNYSFDTVALPKALSLHTYLCKI